MESVGMNRRFWSGKQTFVTGHTGFKGSWLCAWLLDAGAAVSGYALPPDGERALYADALLEHNVASTYGDIRDVGALADALRESKAEFVFHLAAQPLVRESYARPLETFAVNVVGTANVLDAARATKFARAVVVVTSDKCYGTASPDRRH